MAPAFRDRYRRLTRRCWTAVLAAALCSTCALSVDHGLLLLEPELEASTPRTTSKRLEVSAAREVLPALPLVAQHDASLEARILSCTLLPYDAGASDADDRPPFVRAASGLAELGEHVAVVQDDAQFLGLWHPSGSVTALHLPRGADSRRRFESRFDNRHLKLDVESALSVRLDGRQALIGFGSGSLPERRRILIVYAATAGRPSEVKLVDGAPFYDALRAASGIGDAGLNIEGAAVLGPALILVQRRGADSVNSMFVVDLEAFLGWLNGVGPVPEIDPPRRYDLGMEKGVPFGFSGLTDFGSEALLFTASAEETPSPLDDGPVIGSRVGVVDARGARWTPLRDSTGQPAVVKAESALQMPASADRIWIALDPDDTDSPAALCEVELSGAWAPAQFTSRGGITRTFQNKEK
jgi:hypothetical protein